MCLFVFQIAMARKRTVHLHPPSICELEISLQGVKLVMSLDDEYDFSGEVREREKEKRFKGATFFYFALLDMTVILFTQSEVSNDNLFCKQNIQ